MNQLLEIFETFIEYFNEKWTHFRITMVSQKFSNILVGASLWYLYHVIKTIQAVESTAMEGSIVVVDVLSCALLLSMCDLKAAKITMQCNLMQELILYEFKLSHNNADAT